MGLGPYAQGPRGRKELPRPRLWCFVTAPRSERHPGPPQPQPQPQPLPGLWLTACQALGPPVRRGGCHPPWHCRPAAPPRSWPLLQPTPVPNCRLAGSRCPPSWRPPGSATRRPGLFPGSMDLWEMASDGGEAGEAEGAQRGCWGTERPRHRLGWGLLPAWGGAPTFSVLGEEPQPWQLGPAPVWP